MYNPIEGVTEKDETLSRSLFELMFGRKPRESVSLLYEKLEGNGQSKELADYILESKGRITFAYRVARNNLLDALSKMKNYFHKKNAR